MSKNFATVRNNLDPSAYLNDVLSRMAVLRDSVTDGSCYELLLLLLPNRWQPAPSEGVPAVVS